MSSEPVKRARGRPKTFDRDHALEVAMDGYWREGIEAVSVNEICRRANISKPGLYREFGGEDELLDAALTRYYETVLAPVMATLTEDRPFRQTLDSMIEYAITPASPESPAGCMFAKMRTARGRLGPKTGEHVDRLCDQGVAVFTTWLDKCAQRGEISLPDSVETTAGYIDAQLNLILNRIAAGENPETVRKHATLAFRILTEP
jgi:AcrR family transcriptional regulator